VSLSQGPRLLPISVVIPAYNREELLPRALASARGQRPTPPAEIVVVDDGSSDGTVEAAGEGGATVIRHTVNSGAASARNTGIAAATQPWVALLDSDDEWLPHHLATLWAIRADHVLVAGSALGCGADPADDRFQGAVTRRPLILKSPAALVYPINFIPASGVMVRRDVAQAVGGYDTQLKYAEDFDLWLKILERGTGVVSPTVITVYHRHEDQKSQHSEGPATTHREIIESYEHRPWSSSDQVARRLGVRAWDNLRTAQRQGRHRDLPDYVTWILRHPQRGIGVLGIWGMRFLVRRRSSATARDGGPSVGLMPGAKRTLHGASPGIANRDTVDLGRAGGRIRALLHLLRRPTGVAVVGSVWEAALVRAVGVRPVRARTLR